MLFNKPKTFHEGLITSMVYEEKGTSIQLPHLRAVFNTLLLKIHNIWKNLLTNVTMEGGGGIITSGAH